jgi:aldehyde:ferredoxin oxidoreductase
MGKRRNQGPMPKYELQRVMKTIIHKGILVWTRNNEGHKSISIVDADSYEVFRLSAAFEYISRNNVSICYYVSDMPMEPEHLKSLFGDVRTKYNVVYSECTGYLWTDEDLKVGGHDLLSELESFAGKYLHMQVIYYREEMVRIDE